MIVFTGQEKGINWTLNRRTRILELWGEGALPDFYPFLGGHPSWMPLRDWFHEVRLEQGITRIGNYAFYPHDHGIYADLGAPLFRVVFPPSLESIGCSAFRANTGMPIIDLRGLMNLRAIDRHAFASCFGARVADMSGCIRLEQLDPQAFWGCDNLACINLEGCISLSCETLRAFRKETPSHVSIIMPDGSVSFNGSSLGFAGVERRILFGHPHELAPA